MEQSHKTNDTKHWVANRVLRNHCTRMIKNEKSGYYLELLHQNLNDPKKFWKLVK